MYLETTLAILTAAFIILWFKVKYFAADDDDPMSYPYASKSAILFCKRVAQQEENRFFQKIDELNRSLGERTKNHQNGEKTIITKDEYQLVKSRCDAAMQSHVHLDLYRKHIENNVAILTGKKTFAEVEKSRTLGLDSYQMEKKVEASVKEYMDRLNLVCEESLVSGRKV